MSRPTEGYSWLSGAKREVVSLRTSFDYPLASVSGATPPDLFFEAYMALVESLRERLGSGWDKHPAFAFLRETGYAVLRDLAVRSLMLPPASVKELVADLSSLLDPEGSVEELAFRVGEALAVYDYGVGALEPEIRSDSKTVPEGNLTLGSEAPLSPAA